MAARGILGGLQPDPDKGKPHRHTRQKIRLMLDGMTQAQLLSALTFLMDTRPEETLDALIEVCGEEQAMTDSRPRCSECHGLLFNGQCPMGHAQKESRSRECPERTGR